MKNRNFLLIPIGFGLLAFIPSDSLHDRIISALTTFSKNFPQEKVYLQLDKEYYASGETIWFKGYVTLRYLPTDLSTNLYVDLIDQSGNILKRDLLPIQDGGAAGSFVLPANFAQGNYRIRAYTAWMLNFDKAFLFRKDIRAFRPDTSSADLKDSVFTPDNTSTTPAPLPFQYAVQFFPEGGDLVDGLESEVAFKAINSDGLPVDVSGKVIDNTGTPVAIVRSVHDAMGSFELKPRAGQSYSAVFIQQNGDTSSFSLPIAQPSGIVLHIFPPDGTPRLYFTVLRSEADKEKYNRLELVAQILSERIFIIDIDFDKGLSGGMIPLDKLPSGIMQVTVMDTTGLPLAERLVFVNNSYRLDIQLDADQPGFKGRAKNVWDISEPDAGAGNFSISVTDADQVRDFPFQDNIISGLLLTSDLKGYVYNPGWYFRNQDTATLRALDLVMMTNGWRRFSWEKILNNQFPKITIPADTAGLVIRGEAKTMTSGTISLIIKAPADSVTYYASAPVNKQGDFMFTRLSFHDTAQVLFQGTAGKDPAINNGLHLDGSFTDSLNKVPITQPFHPAGIADSGQLIHFLEVTAARNSENKPVNINGILLKQVTVTAPKPSSFQKLEDKYTSGAFKGSWTQAEGFDLSKQNFLYNDIFQYLMGKVPGLLIFKGIMDEYTLSYHGSSPILFLDEMPIHRLDLISDIPVSDIAYVKFFYPPFVGAINSNGGAIAVYTRKGTDDNSDSTGLSKGKIVGYTLVKQFYSPDYSVSNNNINLPDERTTLYWNPEIRTDSITQGAEISFFNNDITKRFHVVIEGMDNSGRIGRLDTVIEKLAIDHSP